MSESKLTKHPEGGVHELFAISWPIMLSSAAGCLMLVVDRVILGHYSVEAFNACFGVMQWYWAFSFTALEFVLIAEVFVGQFNGAGRYKEIGPVIWQMIWFCLALFFIFLPVARDGLTYLVAENLRELGVPYLKIIVTFIPINCIGCGALTSFFVGRGETKIISIVVIVSNILNAVLDYALVFGVQWHGKEIIPEQGMIGAAIATVIAQTLSTVILFALFLRKKNQEKFASLEMGFKPNLLAHCLNTGLPNAFNRFVNSFFWSSITQVIVLHVRANDFQMYGISHSIYLLFCFMIEGVGAGTRTICSNAIGSKSFYIIQKNIKSWIILGVIFVAITAIGMLVFPDLLIKIFLKESAAVDIGPDAWSMLRWTWLAFAADFAVYNLINMLIASGDTKFTMYVDTICFFLFAVMPTYIGIVYCHQTSIIFWKFMLLDMLIRIIFFIYRYRSGRWMRHKLI